MVAAVRHATDCDMPLPGGLHTMLTLGQAAREPQKTPDVSSRQQANELIGLIRKLRWMGLEEEAERVQTELVHCGARPADSVLAVARETD
jgi:hypothetical protein